MGRFFYDSMGRKGDVIKALQHGNLLSLSESFYKEWLDRFVVERIHFEKGGGGRGDITTQLTSLGEKQCFGKILSKADGVSAGIDEASYIFERFGIKVFERIGDGVKIHPGTSLIKVEGSASTMLFLERMVLDIVQRMCGIATLTSSVLDEVKGKVFVAATRKTPLGYLDKKAVFCGGGLSHRLGLWDGILLKDNHLSLLGKEHLKRGFHDFIAKAISGIGKVPSRFIEVEVNSGEQAIFAASELGQVKDKLPIPALLLLDNIPPESLKGIVRLLREKGFYQGLLLEASGGIIQTNVADYAGCGIDVVSLGELTHSPKAIDVCLEVSCTPE